MQWSYVPNDECREEEDYVACISRLLVGGAAVGDYDGDGWDDLYVTRLDGPDILFRNMGDGTFEDVTKEAGLGHDHATSGAFFADVDDDGHLDLYVTALVEERYHLYMNQGDGTFEEEAVERNLDLWDGEPRVGMSACFGDYDRDGWLDLHVNEWVRRLESSPPPNGTTLWRNRGADDPGVFDDVTAEAGVDMTEAIGSEHVAAFTTLFTDLDRDGWLDLLVVSDFGQTQFFWNERDGTFSNGTATAVDDGPPTDENGMGVAAGDLDGDGLLDLFVTSIYDDRFPCTQCDAWGRTGNRVYRNVGNRRFEDATDTYGVRDGGWGWGAAAFDYDNDGDLDLAMTNGYLLDMDGAEIFHDEPMRMWRHEDPLPMSEVSESSGLDDTGAGKALLVFDYDKDGDLDVLVVNNAGRPKLYRNDGPTGNYLRIRTEGRGARQGGTNRQGLGAWVEVQVEPNGPVMVREMGACTFLGQNENVAHFGLGTAEAAHEVRVTWPVTGAVSTLSDVDANQVLVVREPD